MEHKKVLPLGGYKLPAELKEIKYTVRDYAKKYGLNVGALREDEIIFEVVDGDAMNFLGAHGGFPVRYPHWHFAMEEEELRKGYEYGLHKIYEMVINSKPAYAYLLETNGIADHKTVIPHVFGHVDFFRNNILFTPIDSHHIVDEMANHAVKIREYIRKYGQQTVSDWIDVCLSIKNLIDPQSLYIRRHEEKEKETIGEEKIDDEEQPARFLQNERYKNYMDPFINPPKGIEADQQKIEEKRKRKKEIEIGKKIPEKPEQDVVEFLIKYAPLENWQREILYIIREEAYYFVPQAQTKIMNEGWASYWHSKILRSDRMDEYHGHKSPPPLLTDAEIIDYADHHSGTLAMSPGKLNPYKLGIELWRYIEERWNKGKFGKEWEECVRDGSYQDQEQWDKKLGLGREKIFEVRKFYSDITFLDEFLTRDFCEEYKLFMYEYDEEENLYKIASRDFENIKQSLLFSLTNAGNPFIYVTDGNFKNKRELVLYHNYEVSLRYDYAIDVLKAIYKIWTRPVYLRTKINDERRVLSWDGHAFNDVKLKDKEN